MVNPTSSRQSTQRDKLGTPYIYIYIYTRRSNSNVWIANSKTFLCKSLITQRTIEIRRSPSPNFLAFVISTLFQNNNKRSQPHCFPHNHATGGSMGLLRNFRWKKAKFASYASTNTEGQFKMAIFFFDERAYLIAFQKNKQRSWLERATCCSGPEHVVIMVYRFKKCIRRRSAEDQKLWAGVYIDVHMTPVS